MKTPLGPLRDTDFPFLPLESTQSHSLDSRVRRRSVPSKFIALIVYLFIASWSIYRLTSVVAWKLHYGKL